MVSRNSVLAVIPARGGSRGIPKKNLQMLDGHPLIAYSIASARAAQSISRLIVSTENEEIAQVCREYGAEVPFVRPSELALDDTPDLPVFQHALAWLESEERYRPDVIVQLRPTSPLRGRGLIDRAVGLLLGDAEADCVRSVTPAGQNPYKMWRPGPGAYLSALLQGEFPEPYNTPRQKLPTVYWQTGHIDVIRRQTIVNQSSLTGRRVLPAVVEARYCVDIDTPRDLALAAWALSQDDVDIDRPGTPAPRRRREWPSRVGLLVLDFDGVLTDDRVWVRDDGHEAVACHRGDGMGLAWLRRAGYKVLVLSTETNPVVTARCKKLELTCIQGLADKASSLRKAAEEQHFPLSEVVYVGNDVNDIECMKIAGFAVAPADADRAVAAEADLQLRRRGGLGAVRELCDEILNRYKQGATRGENC